MSTRNVLLIVVLGLLGGGCAGGHEDGRASEAVPATPMAASYLQGALRMAQQREFEGALEAVARAERLSPNAPEVYLIKGKVHLARGAFEGARKALERAVALDPTEARAWEMLAHASFQARQFRDALSFYREASERETSPFVWQGIGATYQELYRPDSAVMAFEQVLRIDSNFAPAAAALAEIHEDEGRFQEALERSEQASRIAPRTVPYQYMRARLLVQLQRPHEAAPILEEIVHRDSTHYGAIYNLGLAYQAQGRQEMAREALERAARVRHRMRERKPL